MFYPIHCRPFPIHNLNKSEIRYTKILSFCVKLVQTSLANVRWLNTFIPNLCIISTLFDTIYHKIKCLFPQKPTPFYPGRLFSTQIAPYPAYVKLMSHHSLRFVLPISASMNRFQKCSFTPGTSCKNRCSCIVIIISYKSTLFVSFPLEPKRLPFRPNQIL